MRTRGTGGSADAETPEVSVVVACFEPTETLDRCLASMPDALRGVRAEVILAHGPEVRAAVGDRAAGDARTRAVEGEAAALAPELWERGLEAARGEVVIFTVSQCIPPRAWASRLSGALAMGAAGAGGALALDRDTGPVDCAMYLLRYSAFTPRSFRRRAERRRGGAGDAGDAGPFGRARSPGPEDASLARRLPADAEIPGDNAAYARAAAREHCSPRGAGFWEVEFHRSVRTEGGWLAFVPGACVRVGRGPGLGRLLRQRFRHGARHGRDRGRAGGRPLRDALVTPLVPAVMVWRALRRALAEPALRWRAWAALGPLALLAASWAAGEGWGALQVLRAGRPGRAGGAGRASRASGRS